MKKISRMRFIFVMIIVLTIVGCIDNGFVYAGNLPELAQNSKHMIPGWFIVVAAIVVAVNIIMFICRMSSRSDRRDYLRESIRQQQMNQQQMLRQQEQDRLFQEKVREQNRLFQENQFRFQDQQWRDFNDFHHY